MKKNSKKKVITILAVILVILAGSFGFKKYSNRTLSLEQAPNTYENLKTAVVGEVTAKNKYILFAEKAGEEGYINTQKLFLAAADAEDIHINKEYALANGMQAYEYPEPQEIEVLASVGNLQSCVDGENYEALEMYPSFLSASDSEGYKAASSIFRFARDAEASHAVLFAAELERINSGGDPNEVLTYYMCPVCGKLEVSKAPFFCDVCGTPGMMFEKY